jgi:predicted ester cyclase
MTVRLDRWQGRAVNTAELVRAFYSDLWNRWDDAAVDRVLAEDFAFRGTLGNRTNGPESWRGYRDLIRAGSSDFHNDIRSLLVDGDRAAARLLYGGTHDGLLAGMPAT